jgi:hypothetical protein
MSQRSADHLVLILQYVSNELMVPQERREKESKEKAAENSEAPEGKKEGSESKEAPKSKESSESSKDENSDSEADSSETKAEGEKEAAIDLRPLTMEDLRQAKNQVSVPTS